MAFLEWLLFRQLLVAAAATMMLFATMGCPGPDPSERASTSVGGGSSSGSGEMTSSGSSATTGSGGGAAPACDASVPFGGAVEVSELNERMGYGDEMARLTQDEHTVYFSSFRTGDWNLFSAERRGRAGVFTNIRELTELDSAETDGAPTVTQGDTALYFHSDRTPPHSKIYLATRGDVTDDYSLVGPALDGGGSVQFHPYILPNGSGIYWSAGDGALDGFDIYRADASGGGFLGPSKLVVNSLWADILPVLTPDDRTLFFASNRPGGEGGYDIYVSVRFDASDPFGAPTPVSELNTEDNDTPSWVSTDGCRLYFTSSSDGVSRIYRTERQR